MKTLLEIIQALKARNTATIILVACAIVTACPPRLLGHIGIQQLADNYRDHTAAGTILLIALGIHKTSAALLNLIREKIHRATERARIKRKFQTLTRNERETIALYITGNLAERELNHRAQATQSLVAIGLLVDVGNGVVKDPAIAATRRFALTPQALVYLREHANSI